MQPKVTLIASTQVRRFPNEWVSNPEENTGSGADVLAEIAGRNCYQSWERPNIGTRSNKAYIRNIIERGHLSVLEHASATFYITDVSAAFLGQLTRHRHLSFSVESARYVEKTEFINPASYEEFNFDTQMEMDEYLNTAYSVYNTIVADLTSKGYDRKHARQEARFVLPQGTATKIVVTGNMRAWREFLLKRLPGHGADTEIGEVAEMILAELKKIAPNIFQDM